jgi:hypothetical protein
MDNYPSCVGMSKETQLTCQIEGCGRAFKTFRYLVRHLKQQHHVLNEDLEGHWIQEAARRSRRTTGGITLDELSSVTLAYDAAGAIKEHNFVCRVCQPEKELGKASCLKHMIKIHGFESGVVSQWLTHRDGKKIKTRDACTISSSAKSIITMLG